MTRLLHGLSFFLFYTLASAAESGTALPRGTIVDGFVEDTGRALFLVHGDGSTTTVLRLTTGGKQTSIKLPGLKYGRELQRLADGRFALRGIKQVSGITGQGVPVHRILRFRPSGELRTLWEWEDTSGCPELCPGITIAPDGKVWGLVDIDWEGWGRDAPDLWHYGFGDMRGDAKVDRTVSVQFEDMAMKRGPFWQEDDPARLVFLDSEGPVVLAARRNGAMVIHFGDNGTDFVPILDGGDVEDEFRWQWHERVLWARVKNEWRAYHLWNLGLSETLDGPFWRVEASAEPHEERGVVQIQKAEGRWRVEHRWRDPELPEVTERHVSEWYPGSPRPHKGLFVSPGGRHVVAVRDGEMSVQSPDPLLRAELRRALPIHEEDIEAAPLVDVAVPAAKSVGADGIGTDRGGAA